MAYDSIKTALKTGNIGRVYIFGGEEEYLKRTYLDLLSKKLNANDFNKYIFEQKNLTPEAFTSAIESYPVISEYSLVVVYDYVPDTGKAELWDSVTAALSDMPDYCVLVFYYQMKELDMRKSRSKILSEAAKKLGGVCDFSKPDEADLKNWIKKHFSSLGCEADDSAINLLIELCGGIMDTCFNEIQKLCSYKSSKKITSADVQSIVIASPEARTYELTDALSKLDYDNAYKIINELYYMKTEVTFIASAVYKTYINLYMLKLARNKSELLTIQKQLGLRDFVAERYKRLCDKLNPASLRKALDLCLSADVDMKSIRGERRYMLEKLIGDIAAVL